MEKILIDTVYRFFDIVINSYGAIISVLTWAFLRFCYDPYNKYHSYALKMAVSVEFYKNVQYKKDDIPAMNELAKEASRNIREHGITLFYLYQRIPSLFRKLLIISKSMPADDKCGELKRASINLSNCIMADDAYIGRVEAEETIKSIIGVKDN